MRRETADVVVVGSGAGGALIAWQAARAGLRTLVLERGPRVPAESISHDELRMIPRLYKDGGMQLTTSLDLFILQGSCVGGSSLLSNMVLLRAAPSVFAEWRAFGADIDAERIFSACQESERELHAKEPEPSNISESTRRFVQGAQALGLSPHWMLKALGDCVGCGQCNIGCSFGTKQSSQLSHLAWAEAAGARVLDNTEVVRIDQRAGTARWLDARVGRAQEHLRVYGRVVVIAAGAIGSSALLLRSGIRRNVGTRLSFNAASAVTAEFSERVDGFDGDQMTSYLLGDGWLLEASHNPLMSAALTTPGWGADHGRQMRRTRHLAYVGSIAPTRAVGKVVLSPWFGHEEVIFRVSEQDLHAVERGAREAARILLAAGATQVALPNHQLRVVRSEAELEQLPRLFTSSREISLGSAHPQGGNPMSDDPERGAVNSRLRVHGYDNLFVCDASVFPSSIGVNPLVTIFAVSRLAAPHIVAAA